MRLLLVFALLLACNAGDADPSTAPATDAADTTAGPVTVGGGCEGNGDCAEGQICVSGACMTMECSLAEDCEATEYCKDYLCIARLAVGEPCDEASQPDSCASGVCGKVNDAWTCVDACEWGECHDNPSLNSPLCGEEQTYESCKDPCRFVGRPKFVGCADGFLCVGPDVDVIGSTNGHYCWPQDASDYKGPGDSCPIPDGQDNECITGYCGFDSVCAWSCQPNSPNFFCPVDTTCVDRQDPFEFYECV